MLERVRNRSQEESGFTLVELLVVMLILGILAAIAVPSFFSQRDKAKDADAKALTRTAQTAMETYANENEGQYTGATSAALIAIEDTLNNADGGDGSGNGDALAVGNIGADTYSVTVTASTGNTFTIARAANGNTSQTCTTAADDNTGGGCNGGTW